MLHEEKMKCANDGMFSEWRRRGWMTNGETRDKRVRDQGRSNQLTGSRMLAPMQTFGVIRPGSKGFASRLFDKSRNKERFRDYPFQLKSMKSVPKPKPKRYGSAEEKNEMNNGISIDDPIRYPGGTSTVPLAVHLFLH